MARQRAVEASWGHDSCITGGVDFDSRESRLAREESRLLREKFQRFMESFSLGHPYLPPRPDSTT
jgi:hypothetical protein